MATLSQSPMAERAIVTVFSLLEHLQVMSYGNRMLSTTEYHWSSSAKDFFDRLAYLALRFTGDDFMSVYVIAMACSLLCLLLYIVLMPRIHAWNRQSSFAGICVLLVDYVIFGIGFVPIMSVLSDIQYCNDDGVIMDYTSENCWERKQMSMVVFGFFGASAALVMAAVVCPVLKSERKGVETRWVNEAYFPGMMKLLEVGIINIFAAVHNAYLGVLACAVLIIYLAIFQCYRDNHVASLNMGILWAELWVFSCAQEVTENSDRGSEMLGAWLPMFLLGYAFMWCLWFLLKRGKSSKLALEK